MRTSERWSNTLPDPTNYILLAIVAALFGIVSQVRRETHGFAYVFFGSGMLIVAQQAHLLGYHWISKGMFFPENQNEQIHIAMLFVLFVVSVFTVAHVYIWSVRTART